MVDSIIYDVDIASDVKSFILSNLDFIDFSSDDLKNKVLRANDNDLLRIGKTINSPIKIVSVDTVNAKFFKSHLFGNGNEN